MNTQLQLVTLKSCAVKRYLILLYGKQIGLVLSVRRRGQVQWKAYLQGSQNKAFDTTIAGALLQLGLSGKIVQNPTDHQPIEKS